MFTGIIEEIGEVLALESFADGLRIRIGAPRLAPALQLGDSVAVDGVCLTAVALEGQAFAVQAIGTTLSRTTIGEYRVGTRVNLERALALGARLGGHLVQGHVDGLGEVVSVVRQGEHVLVDIRLPDDVADLTVLHGSLAVDGVSLTVNALPAPGVAQVALIPYTQEHTTLSSLARGRRVNLEGDLIGRFVVQYLNRRGGAGVSARA